MRLAINNKNDALFSLCENELAKSIDQNIRLICATKKGTIPMYRDFGLDMQFIDKPFEVAQTLMVRDITEAIERFEPRVKVIKVTCQTDEAIPGRLIPIIEVEI